MKYKTCFSFHVFRIERDRARRGSLLHPGESHRQHDEHRRRRSQQAPDDGTTQRRYLTASFAVSDSHRQHARRHRQAGHNNGTQAIGGRGFCRLPPIPRLPLARAPPEPPPPPIAALIKRGGRGGGGAAAFADSSASPLTILKLSALLMSNTALAMETPTDMMMPI